ncbi:tonB-dependent Receptor Plug domain protein [Glaesserella parasuis MN-H]|nr:tonB-dependent Receptor Plug domain protein [Glaesserella parasuis MN-H]
MANESAKNDVAALDEVAVVSGGSMYKMGEVPVHQAKSAIAISRDELDKQDVKKVDEIGRYQAGFANQVFGNDTNTNWFRVRGAEVSQAVNGLPTFSYGFFTPYVESFGLEAVEVTKGADSMTFGAAQSGGLINYVTKRAHRDQTGKGEFKTNFGTNSLYGFGADYTGKMTDDESVRYRIVASLNHANGEWKDTENKTIYLAPTLEWDISDRTRLSILTSSMWLDGVITIAGFRAKDTDALVSKLQPNGTVSTESDEDPIYRKGFELQADVNLTENWTGTLAYTYTKAESKDSTGTKTRRPLIPTNTLAAKTAYTFSNGMLNGLTVGAGIRYVGHSVTSKGSLYSHARLPSVTLVDLMARYQINQNWSAQLNVDNVGNRKYVAACDYYCYYGAERKVNATVSYKF